MKSIYLDKSGELEKMKTLCSDAIKRYEELEQQVTRLINIKQIHSQLSYLAGCNISQREKGAATGN
jgi:hypothetical protein